MPRINPVDPSTATGKAKELLDSIHAKFGKVPNLLATMAHAPNVLQGYLQASQNAAAGTLSATLREQIAITVSSHNGCKYCVSAHAAMGKAAGISQEAIDEAVRGESGDARTQAAMTFARAIAKKQGFISDEDLAAVRDAGFDDGEIIQIIGIVGMKTFTNFFDHVAKCDIDFPEVDIPECEHACN